MDWRHREYFGVILGRYPHDYHQCIQEIKEEFPAAKFSPPYNHVKDCKIGSYDGNELDRYVQYMLSIPQRDAPALMEWLLDNGCEYFIYSKGMLGQ